ncbi:hypothetical protein [Porphyromonas macacae]|uniref:Uncharacterized protein n=1 Tax=Porphyromonas macacae TaxID=28115 RepID=A0A379DGI9_9PORP|nr:hypothetical protein [Porphyromonas macacae]SUB77479.1 Uncharacterised protein [Porphyromonas macacae]
MRYHELRVDRDRLQENCTPDKEYSMSLPGIGKMAEVPVFKKNFASIG